VSDGTEYAWPNQAHDLRALGDDSYTHAMLAWQRDKGLLSRLLGYRRGAEMLAERVVADADNKDLDTVIFRLRRSGVTTSSCNSSHSF
jgi:hypothetical protein